VANPPQTTVAKPGGSEGTIESGDIFYCNTRDLLADQRGFKLPIGFLKLSF